MVSRRADIADVRDQLGELGYCVCLTGRGASMWTGSMVGYGASARGQGSCIRGHAVVAVDHSPLA